MDKKNLGIYRTSPMGLIQSTYEESDLTVEFIRGFIDMFVDDFNLSICTPINSLDEKIFNNNRIYVKLPFVKKIKYEPFVEREDLDIIFIFSKQNSDEINYIDGLTYEKHIENIIERNPKARVFYVQYNEVNFDFSKDFDVSKYNITMLFNSPCDKSIAKNDKYYGNLDINCEALDLTELMFYQRVSAKDNFYHRVGLLNRVDNVDFEILKTPNSMKEKIYALRKFNNGEDNQFIKNFCTDKYNILVHRLKACTYVFIDKNINKDFYNTDFILALNFSLPVLIDRTNHDIHIPINSENFFNEKDIDSYYSQRYLKQVRIDVKRYYIDYNLKDRLFYLMLG